MNPLEPEFTVSTPDDLSPACELIGTVVRQLTKEERDERRSDRVDETRWIDLSRLGDALLVTEFTGVLRPDPDDEFAVFETLGITLDRPGLWTLQRYTTYVEAYNGHQYWLRRFFLINGRLLGPGDAPVL